MVMMGRLTGDVRVDVSLQLEPPRDADLHQPLKRAKYGRAPERRLGPAKLLVELGGRELTPGAGQRVGHDQALARDALAGGGEPLCRKIGHAWTVAQSRPRIMW